MKKDHQTSLRIGSDVFAQVEQAAARMHMSVADLARALLIEYIAQQSAHPNGLVWPPRFVGIAAVDGEEGKAASTILRTRHPAARRPAAASSRAYTPGEE